MSGLVGSDFLETKCCCSLKDWVCFHQELDPSFVWGSVQIARPTDSNFYNRCSWYSLAIETWNKAFTWKVCLFSNFCSKCLPRSHFCEAGSLQFLSSYPKQWFQSRTYSLLSRSASGSPQRSWKGPPPLKLKSRLSKYLFAVKLKLV